MPYQRDPYRDPPRPVIPGGPQSPMLPTRSGSYLAHRAYKTQAAGDRLAELAGIDPVDPMSRDMRETDGRYMPPTGPAYQTTQIPGGGAAEGLSGLAAIPRPEPGAPSDPMQAEQRRANAGGLPAPSGIVEHEPSLPPSDDYRERLLESLYARLEEAISRGDTAARGRLIAQIRAVKSGAADSRPEAAMADVPELAPASSGLGRLSADRNAEGLAALRGNGTPMDPRIMGSPGPSPAFGANPDAGTPMDPRAMGAPGADPMTPPFPTPRPQPSESMPTALPTQVAPSSTGGLAAIAPGGATPPLPTPRPQQGMPAASQGPQPQGDTAGFGGMMIDDPAQNREDTQRMAKVLSGQDDASDVPEWALPLLAAGLGMMASNNPSVGAAAGEGGLAGLKTWMGMKDNAEKKRQRREDVAYRRDKMEQDAELSRDQIAAVDRRSAAELAALRPYRESQIRANEALANYRDSGGAAAGGTSKQLVDAMRIEKLAEEKALQELGITKKPDQMYDPDLSRQFVIAKTRHAQQLSRQYGIPIGMGASTEPAPPPPPPGFVMEQ